MGFVALLRDLYMYIRSSISSSVVELELHSPVVETSCEIERLIEILDKLGF